MPHWDVVSCPQALAMLVLCSREQESTVFFERYQSESQFG